MQICIMYNKPGMDYLDEVPQISFEYREKDDTIEEFIKRHETQHCYIKITQTELTKPATVTRLQNLKNANENWSLIVTIENKSNLDLFLEVLKETCHGYIFDTPARTWFELQDQLNCGVSEVYISGYLGFCWPEVKKECEKFNVKTRAIVNYADGANYKGAPAIKKFFIRPEDMKYYVDYIDAIEFFGPGSYQEVCYKAYTNGEWFGDISEIVLNLDHELDSRRVAGLFGEVRMKCGMRCLRGSRCSICHSLEDFAKVLEKTDTILDPKAD